MHARTVSGLITVFAMIVVASAVTLAVTAPTVLRGPARAPGGAEERLEQQVTTQLRLDALRAAKAAGTFGRRERVVLGRCVRMGGRAAHERRNDDWEPAIAADPNAPFVYMLTTRYAPKPCPGNCPSPWMALEISSDGGATWSNGVPLCACKGSRQFDPIIEVVPNTGHVYAIYMNGYNVVFTKSTNHGQTWSTPVKTYGQVSWNDKPVHRDEQRRPARVRLVERTERRRPVGRAVPRRGSDLDPDEARRRAEVLLRLRRGRLAERHGRVLREQHPLRRTGLDARPARSSTTRSSPRTREPPGRTSSWTPWRSASRAWRPGAPRTSTSVTAAYPPTRQGTS